MMKKIHLSKESVQNIHDSLDRIRRIAWIMHNIHPKLGRQRDDIYKELATIREILLECGQNE